MTASTQIPVASAPAELESSPPLRSYLFLLAPRARSRHGEPIIHYVLEESAGRAIEVCGQSYPDHRIVSVRDVTDHATAA
jgi:hypothetical protein